MAGSGPRRRRLDGEGYWARPLGRSNPQSTAILGMHCSGTHQPTRMPDTFRPRRTAIGSMTAVGRCDEKVCKMKLWNQSLKHCRKCAAIHSSPVCCAALHGVLCLLQNCAVDELSKEDNRDALLRRRIKVSYPQSRFDSWRGSGINRVYETNCTLRPREFRWAAERRDNREPDC